jgi:hypothetical protein
MKWFLPAVLLLTPPAVLAKIYVPPPYSYKVFSADRQFVFVMLANSPVETDASSADAEARISHADTSADEVRALRGVYRKSGMYRNDGSEDPLWTVNWFAHPHWTELFVASDGDHLVRMSLYAGEPDGEALAFFDKRKLIRSYQLKDFLGHPERLQEGREEAIRSRNRPGSAKHVPPSLWATDEVLRDGTRRFELTTTEDTVYSIDFTSGEVVGVQPPGPVRRVVRAWRLWAPTIAILGLVVLILAVARRRRRAPQSP